MEHPNHQENGELAIPHEIVEEIESRLREDEQLAKLRSGLRDARERHDSATEAEFVEAIRENRDGVTEAVLKEHGLYEDPESVEARTEAERERFIESVSSQLSGDETPEQLEQAFGLVDEEGKATIDTPLFRPRTQKSFKRYLNAVQKFDVASRAEERSGIAVRNTGRANLERQNMHDAVSILIADDLNLDFEAARRLAAKIREERLPGTSESRAYARGIVKELERYGGDLDQYARVVGEEFRERAADDE